MIEKIGIMAVLKVVWFSLYSLNGLFCFFLSLSCDRKHHNSGNCHLHPPGKNTLIFDAAPLIVPLQTQTACKIRKGLWQDKTATSSFYSKNLDKATVNDKPVLSSSSCWTLVPFKMRRAIYIYIIIDEAQQKYGLIQLASKGVLQGTERNI